MSEFTSNPNINPNIKINNDKIQVIEELTVQFHDFIQYISPIKNVKIL